MVNLFMIVVLELRTMWAVELIGAASAQLKLKGTKKTNSAFDKQSAMKGGNDISGGGPGVHDTSNTI